MLKKIKILLLEDLKTDAELIGRALEKGKFYFEKLVVGTKVTYIKALEEFRPDIILADHALPSFNSHEALLILRETGIKIPFILITANISEEFALDVLDRGADDYILKDRLERLPAAIRNTMEKFRLKEERKAFLDELVKNEKHFRALIENISDAIMLISEKGKLMYLSPSVKRLTGFILEDTRNKNVFDYIHADDVRLCREIFKYVCVRPGAAIPGQYRILHKDGHYINVEGTSTNLLHDESVNAFVVSCRDITDRKLAEEKISRANRLYLFLSQINQTIVHAQDEQSVFKEACNIAVQFGKFKVVWIGKFDIVNQRMDIVEEVGIMSEDTQHFINIPLENNGPLQSILLTGASYVCNDIQNDPEMDTWKEFAFRRGYRSCMILPVKRSGRIVAAFNLYSPETNFFKDEETTLLEEATKDISFALDVFEKEKLKLQADDKLKYNDLRLRHAQAIAHLGSWELDFATGIARWSEEALRTHGLPEEDTEQSYESWVSFIHPEDAARVMQVTKDALASLTNTAFFYRILRRDGTVRQVFSQAQFDFIDGKPVGMNGVELDVTEMKEAEDALKQSEENLRLIIDIIPQSIYARDYNGRVVFVNKYFSQLYGLTPEQLINRTITETIPGRNVPVETVIRQDQEVINTGHVKIIPELNFKDVNGKERVFYTTKVPYTVPGKKEKAVLSIGHDIAEQKQAETEKAEMVNEIIKRNKNLEQFSFIVSHNLRAPVANMIGITTLLQEIDPATEEAVVLVQGLATSAKKLDNVIKDLNYALQVKHQVNENKEPVKFSSLLGDIKLSITNLLSNDDVEIISNFTAVDETVTIKSYLYSIFFNLISNSIKYRQANIKPVIKITSLKEGNCIQLTFTDNGLGIDLKKKGDEVFGLYKRFHYHTDGKGVGLYMVKTQVETLGGKISIDSEVDKGTTFKIVF